MENEKIQSFLKTIDESLERLTAKQHISLQEYQKSWELQSAVEREFQKAIQSAMDITLRIITIKNFRHPDEYLTGFDILAENNVIPEEFTEKMKNLVRFRNILVHEYFKINPEKVWQHLQTSLDTLRQFAKYIVTFLEK